MRIDSLLSSCEKAFEMFGANNPIQPAGMNIIIPVAALARLLAKTKRR
ncbi:hypothetical protein FHR23_003227 [Stakelama sediminis]|uniref:Uncharacterized protein n=1 Tax=Stakelama sediminis TaxID=463200 RepID=A0A840Z3D0_9SPHN|nr:hypothetical protein [Stakelama sediminis]